MAAGGMTPSLLFVIVGKFVLLIMITFLLFTIFFVTMMCSTVILSSLALHPTASGAQSGGARPVQPSWWQMLQCA